MAFSWLLRLFGLTPSSFLGSRPPFSGHLLPSAAGGGLSSVPCSHAAEPPPLPPARRFPPAMPPRSAVPLVFYLICTLCDFFGAASSGTEFHHGLAFLLWCTFYGTLLGDAWLSLRRAGFQHPLTQPLPIHIPQGFESPGVVASVGAIMGHSRCLLLLRVQRCSYEIPVQSPFSRYSRYQLRRASWDGYPRSRIV